MYKVFLIEDEIVIREALERMIPWNEHGFELVGKAKDGEIALPMIRKTKPDVLITDIKMPFMDGLTLSGIVKKEFPDIRIVIVSGYDDFEYAKKAIALGVDDYLLKPIAKAEFVNVLQKIRLILWQKVTIWCFSRCQRAKTQIRLIRGIRREWQIFRSRLMMHCKKKRSFMCFAIRPSAMWCF